MPTCEELEALEKAATPAPWGINKYCSIGTGKHFIFGGTVVSCDGFDGDATGNAQEFICALRNAAPRLLAIWAAADAYVCAVDFGGESARKIALDALRDVLGGRP